MLPSPRGLSKQFTNLVIWSRPRLNTLCCLCLIIPLPASCIFFFHCLPPCNIFLLIWLFSAIGSIHQEAQAVKFNCSCTSALTDFSCLLPITSSIFSCTSGLLRLKLSSSIYQVQLLALLLDYSGYNCFLRFFSSSTFFSTFY
jgi:hypothetical protein